MKKLYLKKRHLRRRAPQIATSREGYEQNEKRARLYAMLTKGFGDLPTTLDPDMLVAGCVTLLFAGIKSGEDGTMMHLGEGLEWVSVDDLRAVFHRVSVAHMHRLIDRLLGGLERGPDRG